MAWRNARNPESRMTTREFHEYPNEEAMSLEEVATAYKHGGRKPFSPIAEVEEEYDEPAAPQGRRTRDPERQSPRSLTRKSSMSPKQPSLSPPSSQHSSSSGHSSPRSPPSHSQHPHPPPPTSQPPPLPSSRVPSGKSRPSHIPPKPGIHGGHQEHLSPAEHPKGVKSHDQSGFSWRQPASSKSKDGRIPQPNKVSPGGVKHLYPGPDGYNPAMDPKLMSRFFLSDHLSHENSLLSSEVPTPISDPGDRGSPSGASTPNSTPNYSLSSSSSDTKLIASPGLSGRKDYSADLESKSDTKLHLYGSPSVRASTNEVANFKHSSYPAYQTSSVSAPRHHSGKLQSRPEPSSLASVYYQQPQQQQMWPGSTGRQPQKLVDARLDQFNQNGNHSRGAPQGSNGLGGGAKKEPHPHSTGKRAPPDDKRGGRGAKEKTPSPKNARSPDNAVGGEEKGPGGLRAPKGAEGKLGQQPRSVTDTSPSSSQEELAMINEEEEEERDGEEIDGREHTVLKPEAKVPPYQKLPPPSHPHPHTHPHAPVPTAQAHPYQAYNAASTHTRPEVMFGSPSVPAPLSRAAYEAAAMHHVPPPPHVPHDQLAYQQKHPAYPYRLPPDYPQRSHDYHVTGHPGAHDYHVGSHRPPPSVPFAGYAHSKLPRPEQQLQHHQFPKANIAVAHEAASKGDVTTLRHMLTNHEIDALAIDEHKSSLGHKAAMHSHLSVLTMLVKEAGMHLNALQLPDENFSTPAMLAIQGGHVECLQWLVEEGKVPLEVRDAEGETLMHHAAFHGQLKCLEWLLKAVKKTGDPSKEILDDSGVTPAHFAAQRGHLDCLQLLIDHGYSVVHPDRENQKPLDWADAMGQTLPVRYLMMFETCWTLSAEVARLELQSHMLRKQNEQLMEALTIQDQEHQQNLEKLQQQYEERITKMREQYVDLTASLLKDMKDKPQGGGGGGGGGAGGSSGAGGKTKPQVPVRKAPEPTAAQRRGKPPLPPEASKKRSARESRGEDHTDGLDYRTTTPQEVLEKSMTSVAQRMNASREARKRQTTMATRAFSPLSPVIQRFKEEETKSSDRSPRSQRYTEPHRPSPRVKFASTVTEYPDFVVRAPELERHADEPMRQSSKSSTGHSPSHAAAGHGTSGHSPAHSASGHGSSGHSAHSTSGHGSSGHGSGHSPAHSGSGHGHVLGHKEFVSEGREEMGHKHFGEVAHSKKFAVEK